MTTDADTFDLDPSDEDIFALPDALDVERDLDAAFEDDDLDFDANLRDDRYTDDGIPSWSVWA